LSSPTTPDNRLELNKFQPACAVPFCEKEEKHRRVLWLAAMLYFKEIVCPKILSPSTHPHHVTPNLYYRSGLFPPMPFTKKIA